MKNPLKKLRLWTPIQWFAVGMATLLFVAVFYNMKDNSTCFSIVRTH